MITEDWLALKQRAERDAMIKRAWTVRLLIIFGSVIFMTALILIILVPCFNLPLRHITNLTDRNKPLPVQTYYVYDTDKSLQFELTFLTQAIAIFLAVIIHIGVNAFLVFMVFHICGQLENFKDRMVDLISCKDFNTALSCTVITHLRLIR